jgi:hypothetical protein
LLIIPSARNRARFLCEFPPGVFSGKWSIVDEARGQQL